MGKIYGEENCMGKNILILVLSFIIALIFSCSGKKKKKKSLSNRTVKIYGFITAVITSFSTYYKKKNISLHTPKDKIKIEDAIIIDL